MFNNFCRCKRVGNILSKQRASKIIFELLPKMNQLINKKNK